MATDKDQSRHDGVAAIGQIYMSSTSFEFGLFAATASWRDSSLSMAIVYPTRAELADALRKLTEAEFRSMEHPITA